MITLGIDTGGTYTDAVALDHATGEVYAKGKSPTTKDDLSKGILAALRSLPEELVAEAGSLILSTTLATNACVENRGGRAKLLLLGSSEDILIRVDAERKYGLKLSDVLCVETRRTYDGTEVEMPDWKQVLTDNIQWFTDVEALAVAELYSYNTGAICEKSARDYFGETLSIPVVLASDIVSDLDVIERGATALLNARLLAVIEEFLDAVQSSANKQKIPSNMMIVRSDSSLMSVPLAAKVPVETILSGPAASTMGGMHLSGANNCIIVDMGGTTTDLSLVKDGVAKLTDKGINIGGWSTQIKGVYVETFGLGGDSMVRIERGELTLGSGRILPISFAAMRWPLIKDELKRLLASGDIYFRNQHEILCLAKEPASLASYSSTEQAIIEALRDKPKMISHLCYDNNLYDSMIKTERLEADGVVLRAGFTPTDAMHIKGDFDSFDTEAAEMLALFYTRNLDDVEEGDYAALAEAVYDLVSARLYAGIITMLLRDEYPELAHTDPGKGMELLTRESWKHSGTEGILKLSFATPFTLVGVGAPTHLFLPRVAEALTAECVIPEHAEVANAIGAALAEIRVEVRIRISPIIENFAVMGYRVFTPEGGMVFDELSEAQAFALEVAQKEAERRALERGATGAVALESGITSTEAFALDGAAVSIGMYAWTLAKTEGHS